jgi:proline racemase
LYKTAIVEVPGLGQIETDIAYGGNNYAIVGARDLHISPVIDEIRDSRELIVRILDAVNDQAPVQHPEKPFINRVLSLLISDKPSNPHATVKNVYVDENNRVDRSPCGTGTAARMAARFAKGELGIGEPFVTESIIGSLYRGRLTEEVDVGGFRAALPEITGSAHIVALNQFVIGSDDPFQYGFTI